MLKTIQAVPGAKAYHVYADPIGSWYSPTVAEGSVCSFTSGEWTVVPEGIRFTYSIPADSWIVVTASYCCGEGSAGKNSSDVERKLLGTWPVCVLDTGASCGSPIP